MNPRFKDKYENELKAMMLERFSYKNVMQLPKLSKIVINMGVGEATQNRAFMENATKDLAALAGQKPIVTHARKSNASFKIREGQAIGTKVTLRGARMYEFLDRFVTIALPRVRDFRGINAKAFDGSGNYNIGLKDHTIFPEIEFDKVDNLRGMDIAFHTTAKTDDEARELLRGFDMPFDDKREG